MDDEVDDKKTTDTPPAAHEENDDKKTTDTPPVAHEDNSLREAVARLEETVTGLSAQVAALAPTPGDEKPTSRPWTHR